MGAIGRSVEAGVPYPDVGTGNERQESEMSGDKLLV